MTDYKYGFNKSIEFEGTKLRYILEFDLRTYITDIKLADNFMYINQEDIRLQDILNEYQVNTDSSIETMLLVANKYRELLLTAI